VSRVSLTPLDMEDKLKQLITELTKSQRRLAEQRNLEVAADITLHRAKDAVADRAPKPRRGEFTVAERDAWIDRETRDQWEALRKAVADRENAQDHLRVIRDQASLVQSLNASVRQAYELAGHS
jgi:hypothetical protein